MGLEEGFKFIDKDSDGLISSKDIKQATMELKINIEIQAIE